MSSGLLRQHVDVLGRLMAGDYLAAARRLRENQPPSAAFLSFLKARRMSAYLLQCVDAGLEAPFPPDALAALRRDAQKRAELQARITAQIPRLWPRLEAAGIEAILLKGPFLAERFGYQRLFLDLDLLVQPAQLDALEGVLRELGYRRLSRALFSHRLSLRFAHGFDYALGDIRLDVHWSLGAHVSYLIDHDRIRREAYRHELACGADVKVLADSDALAFTLLSIFEDIDLGRVTYRAFVDLYAMLVVLDGLLDWPGFWARCRREGIARPCRGALALFLTVFGHGARFPRAAAGVAQEMEALAAAPWRRLASLLTVNPGALRNKLWGLSLYESHPLQSAAWWVMSLPFRLAVYRRELKHG